MRPQTRRARAASVLAGLALVAAGAVALNQLHGASALPGPGAAGSLPAGVVPAPGQVGFRGDEVTLRVIDGAGSAPTGTRWMAPGFLQVDADDLDLEGVLVRGGIDFYGSGTLTLTNSVVEGGSAWMVVNGRDPGARLVLRDSTLRWRAGAPAPVGWGNGAVHGAAAMTVIRCDISGTPDGIQNAAGGSVFEQNHIHDLAALGTYPDNTHNDGIQLYGGDKLLLAHNRIDLGPFDPEHHNAAIFLQPGLAGAAAPRIVGNYLRGGGYALRLEAGTHDAVVTSNVFGAAEGAYGYVLAPSAGTVATWRDNTILGAGELPAPDEPTRS